MSACFSKVVDDASESVSMLNVEKMWTKFHCLRSSKEFVTSGKVSPFTANAKLSNLLPACYSKCHGACNKAEVTGNQYKLTVHITDII